MSKFFYVFLIFFLSFLFIFGSFSLAQTNLTVSIRVGKEATMTFSGKTSPNAQVSFSENNSILGTTIANSEGDFNKSLLSQAPGIHNYAIYTTDTNGQLSSTVNYSISLSIGTETTLSNIILPPTINLSGANVEKDDTFNLSGLTVTSSTITLFISGVSHSYSVTKSLISRNDGNWSYDFDTDGLSIGDYRVYAKTTTTDGYQSEVSETKSFKVQEKSSQASSSTVSSSTTPTPAPLNIEEKEDLTPLLPSLLNFLQPFDLDGSGRLEVAKIFETVKFWVELWRSDDNKTCDLNNDKICNIFDFSILLHYIERE